jgi:1-deoxy-D-xylulose-5-phosphate reductoisomerase
MQSIAVLGATGSIGRSTLDVVARHPDRFEVVALSANSRVDELVGLCVAHRPRFACISEPRLGRQLEMALKAAGVSTRALAGPEGLVEIAAHSKVDVVMAAIVGAAGLASSMAAALAGKKLLLANKEALVMAGPLFMGAVRTSEAVLLPIDSEHNAIFQCLPPFKAGDLDRGGIRRILLTGSGGPFRTRRLEDLHGVTPEQACAHPNWVMGRKISVDSATMMNKGLEVIEAHWLFGATPGQIQVVVHPQSVIHSMVEYADGSVIAQLGNPDMRTPIAHALAFPERIESGVSPLDVFSMPALSFEKPDFERFRALSLAYDALRAGGTAPAVLNAANEVAVEAFLDLRLPFVAITEVIDRTLQKLGSTAITSLQDVLEADAAARSEARTHILAEASAT